MYANGDKNRPSFDGKLHFDVSLISRMCNDSWVDSAVTNAHAALHRDEPPKAKESCSYCMYKAAEKDKVSLG